MKTRIAHTVLAVSDMKVSFPFYEKLMTTMGFELRLDEEDDLGGIKSYHSGEHGLYIKCDIGQEHKPFVRDVGLDHIAFRVDSKEEVDRLYELVKTLGVNITRPPKVYPEYSNNYYAFYFRDPDGIPLEIMYS